MDRKAKRIHAFGGVLRSGAVVTKDPYARRFVLHGSEAGATHRLGRFVDGPASGCDKEEMEVPGVSREGRHPEESVSLLAEVASPERFGGVEAGKVLLGEDGSLLLLIDTTGEKHHLVDALGYWAESVHGAAPEVVVTILRDRRLRNLHLLSSAFLGVARQVWIDRGQA